MPNFQALDDRFSLTPWTIQEHKDYVAGRYGQLLGTMGKDAADAYIEDYMRAQERDIAGYETQRELLKSNSQKLDLPPQDLPEREFLEWDPRAKIVSAIVPDGMGIGGAPSETPQPKKRGRKPKVQAEVATDALAS